MLWQTRLSDDKTPSEKSFATGQCGRFQIRAKPRWRIADPSRHDHGILYARNRAQLVFDLVKFNPLASNFDLPIASPKKFDGAIRTSPRIVAREV